MDRDILKDFKDYMDRHGLPYTVDSNPSQEKVDRIKASIKRRKALEVFLRKRYKKR